MIRRAVLPVLLAGLAAGGALPAAATAAGFGFAKPVFVDQNLAGGEPIVQADPVHHTLVYSTHEGTTHIYRPGLASSTTFTFAGGYRNQVNIWTSKDGGRSFKRDDFGGGFSTDPLKNSGFSDPDLTQDEGGRIYNTGINLANDSLFSSNDGGVTWDRGTAQCHDGDRPWLAGAKKDEVFLATNATNTTNTAGGALSHQIFQSTDAGDTCAAQGIPDAGDTPGGGSYTGNGKLYYDHRGERLVEPVNFTDKDGKTVGLGVGTWKRGDKAFTPHKAVDTSIYAHWAAIAFDDAGGLYEVYDDDPRAAGTAGGCEGAQSPLPSHVSMVHSADFGEHWDAPVQIAAPAGKRTFWPWIAGGDKGKVSIVWYQTDKVVDLACQAASISILAANVTGADTGSPQVSIADAAGRAVSNNNICQSGTTCVATGEDRRLGDFFTNALDEQGCVIIGSGDTTSKDPLTGGERNVALPIFLRQDAGPSLRGGGDCSGAPATISAPVKPGAARRPCVSRRAFRIRLRQPRRDRLTKATVFVAGKRVKVLRGRRLRTAVDLRGLPKGTFTVKIQAVTRKGRHLTEVRTYHTCAKHKA
jgi:hypothetical protein